MIMNSNILNKFNSNGLYNFSDNYIFNPISDYIIPIFRYFNFTPNQITILSTLFNITSLGFYINNFNYISALLYFIGYLLDCIDGRYARKYNLDSTYGMMLDQVTDVITNIPFNIIIIFKKLYKLDIISAVFIVVISDLLMLSFSLEEAYDCIIENNHDDFYNSKKFMIIDNNDDCFIVLYSLFLIINNTVYNRYRKFIENQNYTQFSLIKYKKNIIKDSLKFFIQFGTGNYCLFIISMILT
jgi:hypothetical protein